MALAMLGNSLVSQGITLAGAVFWALQAFCVRLSLLAYYGRLFGVSWSWRSVYAFCYQLLYASCFVWNSVAFVLVLGGSSVSDSSTWTSYFQALWLVSIGNLAQDVLIILVVLLLVFRCDTTLNKLQTYMIFIVGCG